MGPWETCLNPPVPAGPQLGTMEVIQVSEPREGTLISVSSKIILQNSKILEIT